MAKNNALIVVDYINDVVHPDGKLSGKGYSNYVERHGTLARVKAALDGYRSAGALIVHVRVGFTSGYVEHPTESPLFGKAKEFRALEIGKWGTEFVEVARPKAGEVVLTKHRVSAFYGTGLDLILRARDVTDVVVIGVATDLAVESTVRDAHDRDYRVTVLGDCCAAASDDDHTKSIAVLRKIAVVKNNGE